MKAKTKRSADAERLIKLYDSFRMVEFMDQSASCDDINVCVMRMLCGFFGRYGRNCVPVFSCGDRGMFRLKMLAQKGDSVAQANLGQCYHYGLDVERDEALQ